MQLYLSLLKAFLKKETYEKFYSTFDKKSIEQNYPEIGKLFSALPKLHESSSSESIRSKEDLLLSFLLLYPRENVDQINTILSNLEGIQVSEDLIKQLLQEYKTRSKATELAKKSLLIAEGMAPATDFNALKDSFEEETIDESAEECDFIQADLEALYTQNIASRGLRWRLDSLNKALGSLRKGDFGFVFARPETGKTTFLASEITHMASQGEGSPILWFNNEEQGAKVLLRCYQAALGVTLPQLLSNRSHYQQEFIRLTNDRIKIVANPALTKSYVEGMCAKYRPGLIIFDQIDKIQGFQEDRNDLELKSIYQWARELAKQYGPVIGICQAGSTGEGKRWLTMNDVDSSKTGKQGEADWILGIGKSLDDAHEAVRYLHLSKNKLQGDEDHEEDLRHGKWEVKILPEVARYEDY